MLQHKLIGQTSDIKSAHPGQAACPCWASTLPQLGKHRAHFNTPTFDALSSHNSRILIVKLELELFCWKVDVKRNYYSVNHLILFFFYVDVIYLCIR